MEGDGELNAQGKQFQLGSSLKCDESSQKRIIQTSKIKTKKLLKFMESFKDH